MATPDNLPDPRPPIPNKPIPPGGMIVPPGNPGFPATAYAPAGQIPKPQNIKPGQTVTQDNKYTGS